MNKISDWREIEDAAFVLPIGFACYCFEADSAGRLLRMQLRILKLAHLEWRNYLIQYDFPTEDVDRILIRLYK